MRSTESPDTEYADGDHLPLTFVRASAIYDVADGERQAVDWTRGQSLAESQAEIEAAVGGIRER